MNILEAIGNTPLVELKNINSGNKKVKIYGKLEACNPGGSIKDRTALYMIKAAEDSGELAVGKTIIEATSGNTGIALAMIGASKGYRVKLLMPECVSSERLSILEAFGAEVALTPATLGTDGAASRVRKLIDQSPEKYFWPNQFENPNNVSAHYETTGPEIFRQLNGDVDVIVAGLGTTGTIVGISRYMKEVKPDVKIIGVEPVLRHKIQGLKNMQESDVPPIFDPMAMDEKINIDDDEAFEICRQLAKNEGLLLGMSSGAAVAAAVKVRRSLVNGNIAVILPDRGDRYLSTNLFRSICGKCPP